MIKKIMALTKIFFVDYFKNLAIVDKKTNKFNKKSFYAWLIIILMVAISYISYKAIDFLGDIGQEQIFLNAYFLILSIVIAFQTILVCTNVFYFSKDLEFVLPLPIQPVELLIAKFNTVLGMIYTFEVMIGFPPLLIYGLMCSNLAYLIFLIPVLALFPIFICLIISTAMLFVMKLSKFIKNKDVFQVIIVLILTTLLTVAEIKVMNELFTSNQISNEEQIEGSESTSNEQIIDEIRGMILGFNTKLTNVNKTFLVVNPCVNILNNPSFASLLEFAKIIAIEAVTFTIFVGMGKITYLKNLLKNVEMVSMNKKNKRHNAKINYKSKKVECAYVLKEFKGLIKNPAFFMQCIFPIFVLLIVFIALANIMWPIILDTMALKEMKEVASQLEFNIDFGGIILCIIQVLFTLSNISITAISREGKNAILMKYIPVQLYKQFIYKNIPQIMLNTVVILTVLITIHFLAPIVSFMHLAILLIIAMLINVLNSYLMVIADLKRPNLDWDSEYVVMKQNNNKLFQYVTTVCIVLFILYFAKVCNGINLNINIALISLMIIFAVILIIVDKYVKINSVKLFKNIN